MSTTNKTTNSKVKGTVPENDLALSRAFEFGDEDSGLSFAPQDQDSRSPVGSVVSGALEGFYNTVVDQDFITDRVKDAFPDSFTETLKSVDVVTRSVGQLYDDSVKEIKPQLSGLARKIDRLVPENQKFLKSISKKFAEWSGGNQQGYRGPSTEEIEEKTIQDSLADLFKAQAGVQTELAARGSAERQIDRTIEKKQFSASMEVSTESYNLLSRLTGYTEGINQAFQKKSIELQFRQLFATRELLRMTKEASEANFRQNEAIVKNTGLPDFTKIHNLEMLREQSIKKLIGNAQHAMFGDSDPLTAALGRMTKEAKGLFQGFKTGLLDPLKQAADIAASQFEEGGAIGGSRNDNLNSIGGMAGMTLGEKLGDWGRDKIKKYREEIPGYELVEKFGTFAKTDLANPAVLKERFFGSKEVQDFIDKRGLDDDSIPMKIINGVFDILGQKFSPQTKLESGPTGIGLLDPNESGFSKRSDQTLNVVLPGYLARILRAVSNAPELTIFDHNSGVFKTTSTMSADIKKNLVSKFAASSTKRDVNDAYEALFKDETLTDEEKVKAKKFILGLTRENIGYTSKGIQESDAFKNLTVEEQLKYKEIIESRIGAENDPNGTAYNTLTKRLLSAQKSQPNVYKDIQTDLSLGRRDELIEAGLIRKNSSGEYEIVIEEVLKMMDEEATKPEAPTVGGSDINLKRNIKKVNPRDAIRSLRNTEVSSWKYRKDRYGKNSSKTTAYGPMAQDVRAHMGDEAAPDGKKIDLISMNGISMAAIKDLDERLLGQEKRQANTTTVQQPQINISAAIETPQETKEEKPKSLFEQLVSDIKKDTSEMVELLSKSAMFGFFNFSELADFDYEKNKEKIKEFLANKRTATMTAGEHMLMGIKKFGKSVSDKFKKPLNYIRDKVGRIRDLPGKAYRWGKKKIEDNYETVKNLAKRAGKATWDAGASAVKFGVENIPKAYRATIDTTKATGLFLKRHLDLKITDVFIAGEKEPRLRANLMRNGFYFDQKTGKVILDWTDVKGTIVDENKNIILTTEEIAKGLYDVDGKPLELPSIKAIKASVAFGIRLLKSGKDTIIKAGKKSWEIAKLIGEKASNLNFGGVFGFPGFEGMSLVSKKTHNVLIQIRDMMAKKFGYELPPDEVDDNKDSKVEKATKTLSKWKGKIKEQISKTLEAADSSAKSEFVGPLQPRQGFFSRLKKTVKDKTENLSAKLAAAKAEFENQRLASEIGPQQPKKEFLGKFKSFVKDSKEKALEAKAEFERQRAASEIGPRQPKQGLFNKLKASVKDKASSLNKQATDFKNEIKNQKLASEIGPQPERKGGAFERYRQLQEEIKNRVTKKSGVSTELRYQDTSNSFLSKAMGMISGVTDWFKDKLGGLFGTIGSVALGGLGKGLSGAAGVIGKGLSSAGGALFKGAGALFRGQASSLAARGILGTAARTAATAALTTGSPLLAMGSMALSGAMAVISSPVVLGAAAVALAGYGAYKSYKYLTRNNIDKWQKIRVKQYGLSDSARDASHYHKLMELENLISKNGLEFKNNQASIGTTFDFKKAAAIFGLDSTDKDKFESLLKWFNNRFKPFFLTHQTALYGLNKKYRLANIEDMTIEDKIKYLDVMAFPDGPYGVTDSPFSDIEELDTDQGDVLTAIENIKKELREQKSEKKFKEVPKPSVDKTQPNQAKPAVPDPTVAKPDNSSSAVRNAMKYGAGGMPGEDGSKPAESASGNETGAVSGGFKVAPGPIGDGKGGMQFIKVGKDTSLDGLNPAFLKNLAAMAEEYGQITGKSINVNEGFRTFEQQSALYRKYPNKAAKPGSSLHEKGLAVDINTEQLNELDKLGLLRKYGITRPVGGETWHAEPVGIQLNINRARTDTNFAQMAIEAGLLKGGKGAGTNPNVPFGKRNIADVHAALNGTDTPANNKPLDETQVATASKAMGVANTAIAKASESSKVEVAKNTTVQPRQSMQQAVQNKPPSSASTSDDGGKLMSTDVAAANANSDALKGLGAINPKSKEDVMRAIDKAAQMTSVEPSTLKTFAALESGFKTDATPPEGSAKGLFQFIDGTWKSMIATYGKKYGLDGSAKPTDPVASSLMAGEYIKANMKDISKVKPNVNVVDSYLGHFLGGPGARQMLSADPNEIAAKVNPKAARANYNMFASNGKLLTVGEFYDKVRTKIVNKAREYGIALPDGIFNGAQAPGARPASFVTPYANPVTAKQETKAPISPAVQQPRPVATIAPPINPIAPNQNYQTPSTSARPADSFGKLEDLGQKQLTELQTLVKHLSSIDSKLDLKKLAEVIGGLSAAPAAKQESPAQNSRPGKTMVDDRRYEPSVNIRRT